MDFDLSEDQTLLQSAVREFAEEKVRPRAARIDQSGEFPRDLFREAGDLGLAGVCVPAEYGGSGMDTVSYTIVIEEIVGRMHDLRLADSTAIPYKCTFTTRGPTSLPVRFLPGPRRAIG